MAEQVSINNGFFLLGDIHTVTAFRINGITGVCCNADTVALQFGSLLAKNIAGIVLITTSLAQYVTELINTANLSKTNLSIIEIPGIDDSMQYAKTTETYIKESLGIKV